MEPLLVCLASVALPFVAALVLGTLRWQNFHQRTIPGALDRIDSEEAFHQRAELANRLNTSRGSEEELLRLASRVRDVEQQYRHLRSPKQIGSQTDQAPRETGSVLTDEDANLLGVGLRNLLLQGEEAQSPASQKPLSDKNVHQG